jgi:hypothetical protein
MSSGSCCCSDLRAREASGVDRGQGALALRFANRCHSAKLSTAAWLGSHRERIAPPFVVLAEKDLEQLKRWLENSIIASSFGEVIDDPR